jgi:hypothetical protein
MRRDKVIVETEGNKNARVHDNFAGEWGHEKVFLGGIASQLDMTSSQLKQWYSCQ